jgi:hypothetical protein
LPSVHICPPLETAAAEDPHNSHLLRRLANQIEKNESPAVSPHVANRMRQIAFAEMMAQVHGEGDVGKWQRVAPRVVWEPAPDLIHNKPGGTSHIQNSTNRKRIPADGAADQVRIAQPAVDSGKVTVCNFD